MSDTPSIAPRRITPAAFYAVATPRDAAHRVALPLRTVLVMAVLTLAAITVLAILPAWGPSTAVKTTTSSRQPPPSPAPSTLPEPAATDEQLTANTRRTAQILLRASLARVAQLRSTQVEGWARAGFHRLQENIAAGEKAYREQRFIAAQEAYRAALVQATQIEASLPAVVNTLLKEGDTALAQGNSAQAAAAFEQVLLIQPAQRDASLGRARAASLDRVGALVEQAEAYEQMDAHEQARAVLLDAAKLDPRAEAVKLGLTRLARSARKRDLSAALSAGHVALARGDFKPARTAFKRAATLDPHAAEASQGLRDTARRAAAADIAAALERAARALRNEAWHDAARAYGAALALDDELGVAAEGKRGAEQRAQLESQLTALATDVTALVDDPHYAHARQVLATAQAITAPGPRLRAQVATLTAALELARAPVRVTLLSDGHSRVSIDGLGAPGRFTEQALTLTPGRYRALVRDDGHADQRIEFTITPGASAARITLQSPP